jgi:hypothetical protein
MGIWFVRVREGNMSDIVDEVECNVVPSDKFTMLKQMKKITEASHYLAQNIHHSLMTV